MRADHILGLAMSVFRTDSVLLHLRDGDQVFARGGDDAFSPGIRAAACRLLEPAQRGITVVEDVAADGRSAASASHVCKVPLSLWRSPRAMIRVLFSHAGPQRETCWCGVAG